MARLITSGNIAIFEYPDGAENPSFDLDKNGVLFIIGYPLNFAGNIISSAKRFELNLKDYILVGNVEVAKEKISGDFSKMIEEGKINESCAIVLAERP